MKARFLVPLLALAVLPAAQAQEVPVSLTDAEGAPVNGQVLHVSAALNGDPYQALAQSLRTTNITEEVRSINIKRYELDVLPGTQNYFCWTLCYDALPAGERELWVAHMAVSIAPGESFDGFYGDYMPMGITGTSTFRFVWFDVDNPNDSTSVDVVYTATGAAGVNEASAVRGFTAFPNPSMDGNITFGYDLGAALPGTRLAVYNLLGERKLVRDLGGAQGRVALGGGELGNGVWFAVLERNGKALATKRVVVAR